MRYRDDIYVYEWTNYFENNCNTYYIGGDVHALIDPGLSAFVPELLERMKKDGIHIHDIRYVLNTHSHPDHFEGSKMFYGRQIQIGLHEDEIDFLKGEGGDLYPLFGLATPAPQIDWIITEGEVLLGKETLQIFHVPGHSPGSIALYSPQRNALFAGDVIFQQSVGRTDFPGGNGTLLKNSILQLSRLEIESLFPGHMGIVAGNKNVKRNFLMIIENFFPYL